VRAINSIGDRTSRNDAGGLKTATRVMISMTRRRTKSLCSWANLCCSKL